MPCFRPLDAWRVQGQRKLVFHQSRLERPRSEGGGLVPSEHLQLRCGKCLDCRSQIANRWATRMVHESQVGDGESYFLTLTYDDAHLPAGGELVYRDFQLFMKKLRHDYGAGIKFVMCGEYGDKGRPHYHACIFHAAAIEDVDAARAGNGQVLESSRSISELWGRGFVQVAPFNEGRALYLSKYMLKQADLPASIDPGTGKAWAKRPPFRRMSLRPGIGANWFSKFGATDYARDGSVVLMTVEPGRAPVGHRAGGNSYYDGKLETVDPLRAQLVKAQRKSFATSRPVSKADLESRERYMKAMQERGKRSL